MTSPVDAQKPADPPPRSVFVAMAALSVLPVTVYLPVLPDIAEALGTGFALVNLSIAGYAVATAMVEAVSGALSDRYGRRPVVLASVSVFVVASVGCALAPNIVVFLVCRMFQAAIAACFSVAMVAIRDTSDDRDAVRRIGFASMGWALAPMVGPALGGALGALLGWRSIFAALAVLGGVLLLVAVRRMEETSLHPGPGRGSFASSFRKLLGSPRFWAYTLCMACSTGTLYVFLGGAPLVMSGHLGGSSAALGFYMAMVPGGFILGSYLAGVVASRLFRSHVLVCARVLTCGGLLAGLVLATSYEISPLPFFVSCMFIGMGNGLTTPVVTMGVMSERDDLAGSAVGLSGAVSIGGGAAISSSAGLLLGAGSPVRDLLALVLASASLALVAALFAALVDREPRA
ncbi:Bcr/CflA family drug resistance efflux transporter [Glycomyces fuscus]|nr:Bcr/CflA family drug resistance efflux transporter [Glycomyces fuscus]